MLENIIITKVKAAKNDLEIGYSVETDTGFQPFVTKFDIAEINPERYKKIAFHLQRLRPYAANLCGLLPDVVLHNHLSLEYESTEMDSRLVFKVNKPIWLERKFSDYQNFSNEINQTTITEVVSSETYRFIQLKGDVKIWNAPTKFASPKINISDDVQNGDCLLPYSNHLWLEFQDLALVCQQLIRNTTQYVAGQLALFGRDELEEEARSWEDFEPEKPNAA